MNSPGSCGARRFYDGLDVRTVDFDVALRARDPLDPPAGVAPVHPSYEDRPGEPDAIFASLDDAAYERQVEEGRRRCTRPALRSLA